VVTAVAAIAAVLLMRSSPPDPRPTADALARAWTAGDDRAFGAATDDPRRATAALRDSREGLDGAAATVRVSDVALSDGERDATARLAVRWRVAGVGAFAYRIRVRLRRDDEAWRVLWRPSVVHPRLRSGQRLGTAPHAVERGRILDRSGRALVTDRPIVRVGIDRARATRDVAAARRLAAVLDIGGAAYARQVRAAGPKQFVEALTVRAAEWPRLKARVGAIAGAVAVDDEAPLAPTRAFARAVLGGVGAATAEQVERSDGRLRAGDDVGQWGLQQRFDARLRGTPAADVVVREQGVEMATLQRGRPRDGRPLRTTLDRNVQAAAERALGDEPRKVALVAVQPATGDVLAVANRPVDDTFDRALAGRYPPGSTFKVATTLALLREGLDPATPVACPQHLTVDGRRFKNFENGAAGRVPFATDFAESCNTAFVSLADRVGGSRLPEAARALGLGERFELALDAPPASVPAPRTPVEEASASIGQDRILASPLSMAGVAATVADGRWRAPRLLQGDPRRSTARVTSGEVGRLRTLMRAVVTSGTGTALAGLPGAPAGKSGTAEYGGGDPPPTHAWFIGYRGDLAFAVLVEGGRAGGTVAAPIAARFLTALPERETAMARR
jgi:cell division protein FtsI/penicillin-binding protein 2